MTNSEKIVAIAGILARTIDPDEYDLLARFVGCSAIEVGETLVGGGAWLPLGWLQYAKVGQVVYLEGRWEIRKVMNGTWRECTATGRLRPAGSEYTSEYIAGRCSL